METQSPDKNPLRRLLYLTVAGMGIFMSFLLVLQLSLVYFGTAPDPSVFKFYPIMAGLGALFGFERWWSYEQGEYNPFHESAAQ